MFSRRWNIYAGVALLSLSLAACGNAPVAAPTQPANQPTVAQPDVPPLIETPTTDGMATADGQTAEEIAQRRQAWLDRNLANYRYTIERSCFCPEESRGPVTVEVRGDQVTITNVASGEDASESFDDVRTITRVYDLLEQQANEGADEIAVTYDEANAVPLTIKVDVSYQMADEELYYTISTFEVIQ